MKSGYSKPRRLNVENNSAADELFAVDRRSLVKALERKLSEDPSKAERFRKARERALEQDRAIEKLRRRSVRDDP